jgi:hypothetical protein
MKTTFSRRELYAFGEPIGNSATVKKIGGGRIYGMGGGGSSAPTQTTVQNTNVPEYARPYVETMLGATQEQLFTGARNPDIIDPETGQATQGTFNITGFKPYQAYGGTYDAAGKQLTYDPSKAVAGFSDMQKAAQQGIAGMQMPGGFANASSMAGAAGQGGMDSAAKAYGYGAQGQASGLMGQSLGIAGGQKYGEMGAGYGAQGAGYGAQAAGLASPALAYGAKGAGYGDTGAGYGAQAAQLANTALGYGKDSSNIGQMGLRTEQYGRQVSGQAEDYARQAAGAGAQYAQMATDPRVTQALMNPYTQNVLDVQNRELDRQASIAGTQRGAQAARSGAFGGSRQAIENAEANRNLAGMKTANTAQALNQAYQQAQQAQQFGANLNLQGLQGAQQGLGTALSGGQLGLSGIGTALQGQQGALSGVGQAGAMYGLGMQGSQTGIQGTQAGLAGVNAANQAYQAGIQGSQAGMQGASIGLQGVDRQLAGTAQGMQGAQVGLQGVSGAQAGYGLANQAASNMSNIAGQQQQGQLAMLNAQNTIGAQQQALEQQKINQAMQDYANAQQYPLMQLGTMSNMLRGLPMQASSTQQYQAQPSAASQLVGAAGAGASLYNALKAEGGVIKGYAGGGIMSYDMGGEVEGQLENMDEKGLATQARESTSPSIRRMAQRILRERQMGNKPQGTGPMGVQYQAPQAQMPAMRGGGIIAFAKPTDANNQSLVMDPEKGEGDATGLDPLGRTMEQRLAMEPAGIMSGTAAPAVPASPKPLADVVKEATRQRDIYSTQANRSTEDVIKEIQAERTASGIGDNKAREDYRAQQMAERANTKDEQERQRYMRMAEFFASWGSTPGPTLVAGMNALKQSIPGIISDEKEAKKARKEADKIIYDIDEATRLDKLGMHTEATARREKAAGHAQDFNKQLLTFQAQIESNKKALEVAEIQAKGQLDAANVRAKSDSAYRTQTESNRNEDRIYGRYLAATKEFNDVVTDVARQESQDAHKNDLKKLEQYTMGAKDKKTGEINPDKINKEYKAPYAETLKRVNDRKEGWATAISNAKKEKDTAYTRYTNLGGPAAANKPKGAPKVSLDDPSLQKQ